MRHASRGQFRGWQLPVDAAVTHIRTHDNRTTLCGLEIPHNRRGELSTVSLSHYVLHDDHINRLHKYVEPFCPRCVALMETDNAAGDIERQVRATLDHYGYG